MSKKKFGFLDFWFQVCARMIDFRWPRGLVVILIPKILRYSFKQAANHQCGDWALGDGGPGFAEASPRQAGIRALVW